MAMASIAAQAGGELLKAARQNKWASRGLQNLSQRSKNRFVKGLLSGGANAARFFGFKQAISDGAVRKMKLGRGAGKRARAKNARAAISLSSGATTVGAGDAPVAFARTDDLRPSFRAYPSQEKDGLIVHSVDFVGSLGTSSATAGAWLGLTSLQVSPSNATLHPWLSAIAPNFQRYKLKFLKIHYQHFVGTAVAGQVTLQYSPDPILNTSNLGGLTQTQSQNSGNYMTGALYEDFAHQCDLSGLDPGNWYDTETSLGSADANANYSGQLAWFTANAAASQASTGNIFVEAVYELHERKLATITVGLSKLRALRLSNLPAEKKIQYAHMWVDAVFARLLQEEEEALKKARNKVDRTLEDLLGGMALNPPPQEEVELVQLPKVRPVLPSSALTGQAPAYRLG